MKFAAGFAIPLVTGKRGCYQLVNPEGSNQVLTVVFVESTCPPLDAYWTIRSLSVPLANPFNGICNQEFGAGAGVGQVYYESVGTAPGNIHSDFWRRAGEPLRIDSPPIVTLNPGKGMALLCHAFDAQIVATIEWGQKQL